MVVARRPWVTIGLVVACIAAHGLVELADDGASDVRFHDAVAFFAGHPETEVDPRLVPAPLADEIRRAPAEAAADDPDAADPVDAVDAQTELDRRTEAWLAATRRAPRWRFGLIPAERGALALVSHQFVHGGWLHLAGNLFLLYLMAPLVEDTLGRGRFLALYLGLGAFAGLAYSLHVPGLYRPLVGASGAISAVLGLFVVLYARVKLRYLLWIGVPLGTFDAPAWTMLPVWFGFQVALGWSGQQASTAGMGGVAYWAHAWGFAAGVAAGFALRGKRTTIEVAAPDALAVARRAIARNDPERAWRELTAEIRAAPDRGEAILELWHLARRLGRVREAAPAFARLVWREARTGDPLRAAERWQELRVAERGRPAEPRLALEVAAALARAGEGRELREEILEAGLEGLCASTPPEVARDLATQVRAQRSLALRRALETAAARPELPPSLRTEIRGQLT
jgi:membrane associated rhomboid family serine protease